MNVVFTLRAVADLTHQHEWGKHRFGEDVANRTFNRVRAFIETSLADRPRAGRQVASGAFFESWIPRTPFVVLYRIDDDTNSVVILAVLHHAQDRRDFDPDVDL